MKLTSVFVCQLVSHTAAPRSWALFSGNTQMHCKDKSVCHICQYWNAVSAGILNVLKHVCLLSGHSQWRLTEKNCISNAGCCCLVDCGVSYSKYSTNTWQHITQRWHMHCLCMCVGVCSYICISWCEMMKSRQHWQCITHTAAWVWRVWRWWWNCPFIANDLIKDGTEQIID